MLKFVIFVRFGIFLFMGNIENAVLYVKEIFVTLHQRSDGNVHARSPENRRTEANPSPKSETGRIGLVNLGY